jgi:hypothetical protein
MWGRGIRGGLMNVARQDAGLRVREARAVGLGVMSLFRKEGGDERRTRLDEGRDKRDERVDTRKLSSTQIELVEAIFLREGQSPYIHDE